ncbi:MAG: Calx-beta domain-containing protein, partial [Cyanobacteria bacterium P01_F01_bin.86]
MATASRILQPLWLNVAEQLQQFLADTDLTHKLYLAFGREFDLALAISLIQDLISGDAHPNLEILPTADINGANGAFAGSTGVVYLAEEFVSANDIETIAGVLLEELGHYLDQQLNHVDSAGDEGAIFSALVRGESLSESELQQLKFEDDGAVANLQGQEVAIEQNTLILVNTTGDEADADPNDGVADVDLNQSGLQTTLRAAIEFANNNAGTDNIEFSIPTTDPGYDGSDYTIQPQSSLPTITEAVVIAGNDDATLPVEKIILDGSQAGLNIDGFTISADGSEISNLEISGFSENGIKLLSSDNTISNNQITANRLSGISVTGNTTTNNSLQNNYISGNTLNGIYIADNGGNTIKENTLIGNEDGIDIRNANGNVIEGNIIGRDGEGNVLRGIYIEGNDNAIGNVTLDAENTISHNGTSGVVIASGTGNSIRGNSIYDNTDLNIDLGNDGITENDPGDNDSGANNLQNSPTIVSALVNGDEISISGNLQSTPNETFQIDFFGNNGEIFLGSQQVTTDSTGEATFSDDQSFVTTPVIPANDLGNFFATATNSDGDTSELSQDYSRRPILLLPGIGGTLAADLENGYLDWLLNRGVDPEDLQIDPLIYAYDDLIKTLENAGYISDPNSPDQNLFIANYDWRLYPGPIDNTIDGTLTGLTGDRISDDTYEYGVDYLGHFLRQATEKWNARFDGEPLASVDIIAHSTGGLVTRAYIQSDAYGDTFTSTSGETLNLPEINNFFMISVPNQGASKNWNPIHDQWIASEEFRKVYSKVINAAYQKVLAGAVVTQGGAVSGPFDPNLLHPGDISLASITDPVTGAPDPVEFIRLYVPTLNSLLATYDFIDDGNGVLTNVNNNLNIQDPNSGNQLLLDLNGGTNSFQLPDSNTFVDQVGTTIAIYGTSKATETTVTQQIGSINGEERFGIVDYSARNAESGEIWYEDNRIDNNGDGSVPLESLRGQFENDLRVDLRGFTEFSNTNSTILNETISETDDGVGHAEIVSNIDVQKLILDQLGLSLDDDQISTDLLASRAERIWSYVNGNISTVISDPVETLFVDGDGNRLGYSSATGVLNEIPNSIYFGKEDGIGWVFGPVKTPVELHLTGLGEDYYVQVSSDQAGVSTGITDSGFLAAGTQKIIDVPIPASYQGTNLCDIVSGVDDVLRTFQSVVDSEIYALALPLLGDNLKDITEDGVQFLTDLQANIVTPLREICNSDNVTSALIFEVINLTLGSSGLNILGDLNGDGIFDAQDIEINETEDDLSFRFSIDDAFTFNTPLEADMGLPGLGLEVDGDAEITFNYGFTLGFGVNKDDGFYFDTSADSELEIGLDVSTPELETTGKLAFLQLDVRDKQDDPSHLDATFKVDIQDPDDIGKLAANEIPQVRFETKLEMAADVNLELEANFDEAAKFPKITTDFHLDWDSNNSEVDHNNPQDLGNKPNIEFKNVTLDTGSFFGNFVDPILGTVQSITEPVQPIIELLTQEIDLQFMKFSLLDLAVLLDDVDQDDIDFVNSIAQVIDVINEIPENLSTDGINLGGFDLGAFDIRTPGADTSQVEPNVSQEEDEILEGSDEAAFLDALEVIPGDGLQFPLLTNPLKAFDLLLGKNVELFTYGLPKFDFNLGYNQYFPILGPLGINLGGEIGAELSLPGFGYDTTGLRQFAEGGDLGDIFNGFYVSDTENADGTGEDIPEVSLTGGFEAAVEVNAGALSFGGGGGLYTGVDFNLNDPNDDGKIRTDEFIDLIDDPECLFDLYLDLTARLFAYLKIGFGFFSVTQRVDSPDLKLVELEHNCKGSRDPDPGSSLATQNGKVLELNTGAGEDDFTLEHVAGTAGNETLLVDAEGAVEEYSGINKIFADGKAKDDYIALDESVLVPAEMFGSGGDDFLIGGSGDDTLYGERGVDKLDGGKGDDTLEGRDGDDFLIGGPGADILEGGDGDDTASYITAEKGVVVNFTNLGLNTGDAVGDFFDRIDHIEGSLYGDTLVGNDKKNLLVGLAGDDTLEGLAGKDTLEGGSGNDTLKGGEDNDILAGGAGSDDIRGGEGEDTASYASSPNGVVLDLQDPSQSTGHAAGDTFQFIENYEGSYHNDTLKGNAQSDEFFGLDGNDVLLGGGGADTLDGGEGYDIASYEDSPTGLLIDIGSPGKSTGFATDDKYVDMEEIQGSSFSDVLMGDNKDNILDGLEGDNLLIGGNGIGNSADDLRAGQGNDTYQLNGKKANGSIIRDRGGNYDLLFLEDFTLSLSGPSQGIAGLARENNALMIDINEDGVIDRDDDLTIKKFFSPRNASVNDVEILEGDNGTKQAIFTVTVDSQDSGAGVGFIETLQNLRGIDVIDFFNTVDVDFETKNGSATATDQDYQPTSGTLSFAPDETTKTVTVDILGDLKEESDEYFTLNLSADNTNIVDSSGKGTIANDDTSISITNQVVTEGDDGTVTANLTVSLSQASQEIISVDYTTQSQTAVANSDYTPTSGTLIFNPGETTKVITVDVIGDTDNELDETFKVELSNAVNAGFITKEASITVLNDDDPDIYVDDFTVLEGDSGVTTANFTVTLSESTPEQVSVAYSTFNDTAIAGLDYMPKSGFLTFQPGETQKEIAVDIIGEKWVEPNEKFTLELSNSINGTIVDGRGVGNIRNEDNWEFSTRDIIFAEGDSGITEAIFTVELSDAHAETVTVEYATADDSAIADIDYISTSGTLSFAPGEREKTLTVEVIGDEDIENDEQFFLNLSNASTGIITTPETTGIIRNDDYPNIAITDTTLKEGDDDTTQATVTVSLSEPVNAEVTVDYDTEAGTAEADLDYVRVQGQLTFAPGETEKTII